MKRFAYLFILTLGCVSILQPQTVAALPAWDPGRIIDDAVFTNVNTMTPSNIQNFLNSKIPSCDTNGTQLSEYGGPDINNDGKVQRWEYGQAYLSQTTFTCLKDYVAPDNRSAAQVIYDTALRYSINPQVFIVLLQKEQGLVTDNWPSNSQYRTATGYGCPDTAPCDSQYYGIINQLDWAGKMFRAIVNNSPTWYTPYILGNNTIRYSPSVSCGSSAVTIQNRSTQALYNYTPYQPNSAALSAGYGNAPPCGSYGNRNFWLYFNNWFGNTNYILGNIPAQLTTYSRLACTIPNFSPNVVGRLYQPDTQDYLFTTNHSEACSAIAVGYVWDGIVFNNVDGQPSTTPVYRVRRGVSHVYTANPSLYTTDRKSVV